MIDLPAAYAALTLPPGILVVSDHAQIALLVVRHDSPNHVSVERVPLASGAIELRALIELAQQHGASIGTPTITVLPEPTAQPRQLEATAPAALPSPVAASILCPDCGGGPFKNRQGMETHRTWRHGPATQYRCPEPGCGAVYDKYSSLWSHRKNKHHGPPAAPTIIVEEATPDAPEDFQ